ncbi:MAG: hypothetical protein HY897_06875 [Deltaproteobacteria bacterium]|nr:hypothetical protein [Deltaproteobacteria bacterium]
MKPKILVVVSNPWTYRNIFCTSLARMLVENFDVSFCTCREEIAQPIREQFPDLTVNTIPYGAVAKKNFERLLYQYRCEAAVCSGESRYLWLNFTWHNDRSRRARLMRAFGFDMPRPRATTDDLRRAMEDSYRGLVTDEPCIQSATNLLRSVKPEFVWLGTTMLDFDLLMTAAARETGTKFFSTVLGWDNLSSKTFPVAPSLAYLIWGDSMEEDIVPYFELIGRNMPLFKVGSPQFDSHATYLASGPSDRPHPGGHGFDPSKPVVFYGGTSELTMANEHELVTELVAAIRQKVLPESQWLVRLHPKDNGRRWDAVRALPGVVVFQPRKEKQFEAWLPDRKEVDTMVGQIGMASLVLNNASTLTLDACALDKPVVNIRFEPGGKKVRRSDFLFEYDHMKKIMNSGAFPVCNTMTEVLEETRRALAAPAERSAAREKISRRIVGVLDGKVAERIVNAVSEIIAHA